MNKTLIKDILITTTILILSFFISIWFQIVDVEEHITTLFAFAVFLISLFTKGYVYGIVSAFVATLAINYAFTFPFFAFNFTIPVNLISAIIMVTIALLTGTLTTRIKHQEQIKAESENERMRANLLRAVSHDIRTPLTTIYGSASALVDDNDNLTELQKTKMLKGIKQDSDWLVRIVENLLSITRIDSGNVKLIKTPTVVDELIDSVLTKFKKRYQNQTVSLTMPEELIIVPMDALLIEQVIVNLLENIVMHAEGFSKIELRIKKNGNFAVFEIEDDGCGVPEERLPRIFDAHFEPKAEIADSKKKNTGIGLSVCASIIRAHGGEIFARNLEKGALFGFRLEMENNNEQ